MNKKEVIFILLNEFADWEGAYIAANLNQGVKPGSPVNYTVKTMSVAKEPVVSIGGFTILPDYGLNDMPEDYAGLVLIGGMRWFSPEAAQIVPLVEKAVKENKLVAGICNASVFLGMNGFLNQVKHTSNGLDFLKQYGGEKYTGASNYINKQAVRDGNIVTANGTAALEFCREILYALEADTPAAIEEGYQFQKNGLAFYLNIVEPTAIKNYDNFFLPADNYQESVKFYSEILGLAKKFEFAEQGMAAFKVGDEEPAIILKDKTKMPNTVPTIWIEVADAQAVYEKLKPKGVVFLSEPFRIRTGWAVEFTDPSGNRLGFTDYKKG